MCHKRNKKHERQPNALKQELERNLQNFPEAQIIAFCPLNVLVWLALFKNVVRKSSNHFQMHFQRACYSKIKKVSSLSLRNLCFESF